MNKVLYALRKKSKKDDFVGHALSIISHLLTSPWTKLVVPAAASILIACGVNQIDFRNGSSFWTNFLSKPLLPWSALGFIVFLSIIFMADIGIRKIVASYEMTKYSVASFNFLFTQAANSIQRMVRSQQGAPKATVRKSYLNTVDFYGRAFAVCDELFRMIQSAHDTEDHLVSLMGAFSSSGRRCIRMVAYGSNGNRQPNTYADTFPIPTPAGIKGYYHQRVFSEGSNQIRVLEDNAAIKREFYLEGKVHERDSRIEQYIGLPIMSGSSGIVALLQIDASKKNQFGSNREDILFFAERILVPFANLLLYYLQDANVAKCIV